MTHEPGADRLKLVIVGGYLGAGKSTWLRHQLYAGTFGQPHLIINEAAELGVDEAIFADRYPVTLLAGGCACCTGQTDFLTSLRQLCDLRSQQPAADRLRLVVLETSGLADPAAIAGALRIDPLLAFHLALAEVIVLVDARNGAAQLASEPLGRRQIEAADRLVLTKTDLSTPDDVARLIATLKTLNPTAPLGAEVKGEPVPLPDARDAIPLPLADVESGPIAPLQIRLPDGLDWASFAVWLSALLSAHGDHVVRVKGTVQTPAGRLLLQGIRDHVQPPEILPDSDRAQDGTIVLIGRDIDASRVTRSLARFSRAMM